MEIISSKIMDYAERHSDNEPQLLAELRRETWQKVINPRMLSGPFQGRLLALLSKLIKPKAILEIGTFTGYSTLCLAEGLDTGGIIHTIDQNEELVSIQQKYFNKSNYKKNIKPYLGDALEVIQKLDTFYDLIFIDADKINYINYYEAVINRLNNGGILLTDNVLWNGKVVEKLDEKDIETKVIMQYNAKLKNDSRIETLLLPIRDGISIVKKIV